MRSQIFHPRLIKNMEQLLGKAFKAAQSGAEAETTAVTGELGAMITKDEQGGGETTSATPTATQSTAVCLRIAY